MDIPSNRPERFRPSSRHNQRPPSSSGSDTSIGSSLTSLSIPKRPPYSATQTNLPSYVPSNLSTTSGGYPSLPAPSRPAVQHMPHSDQPSRRASPLGTPFGHSKHQRQHSQGYFEPSMPSTSLADNSNMATLSASQIAAQAAMQHLQLSSHTRKRSQTLPVPQESIPQEGRKVSKSSPPPSNAGSDAISNQAPRGQQQYRNGLIGTMAAATAANVAFPRNFMSADGSEKDPKKGSKMRMFKPKHIGISRDKDKDSREKPLTSPNKLASGSSTLSRVVNASSTSIADSVSSNSTLYSLNNPSTSTIVPISSLDRQTSHEKERSHKHTGLRQKLKLKDKDDHHNLPLSSASSNSRPLDSDNPSSLYSFEPSSPGPNSNFSKSVSGLDLRHAGRALREKKREAKALVTGSSSDASRPRESEGFDYTLSNPSNLSTSYPQAPQLGMSGAMTPVAVEPALRETLSGFGLHNMTPDDAWDFLKAKILVIFEGEDVRVAVEDLNKLVTIYVQRCVQRNQPTIITDDLDDLYRTGFSSLNYSIRSVPDDRLVSRLVSMWITVFQTILPFLQAVFFPLDLEFKGRGAILSTRAGAADFWGILCSSDSAYTSTLPTGTGAEGAAAAGDELETRRMLLISFRDTVILPRYDTLKAIFSRLSLDSINTNLANTSATDLSSASNERPSTSQSQSQSQFPSQQQSQSLDPNFSSYNSQSSTLLGGSSINSASRSRATSSTSNPAQDIAFQSLASPPAARPTDTSSSQVTDTVGRMLQCLSVLASVQSGDDAQSKMESLAKELKLNWLGRARTGRNRRGFVGTRISPPSSLSPRSPHNNDAARSTLGATTATSSSSSSSSSSTPSLGGGGGGETATNTTSPPGKRRNTASTAATTTTTTTASAQDDRDDTDNNNNSDDDDDDDEGNHDNGPIPTPTRVATSATSAVDPVDPDDHNGSGGGGGIIGMPGAFGAGLDSGLGSSRSML